MYIYVYLHVRAHNIIYINACIYTQIHTHVYIYIYIHIYVCIVQQIIIPTGRVLPGINRCQAP